MRTWLADLRTHKVKRDKTLISGHTAWNTYYAVKVLLDDAVEFERLQRIRSGPAR